MRYAWIDAHRQEFPLADLCAALEVSISGYRAWKRGGLPDRRRLTDRQRVALIRAIHAELQGAYGSPRRVRELRARGFPASKERVERLMRKYGLRARHQRRYKVTTDSKHGLPVAENRLDRNFTPTAPNPGVDVGHHVPVDGRRLAVSCHRHGFVQPGNRRLVPETAHDGRHRHRCADHGLVQEVADAQACCTTPTGAASTRATPSKTGSGNTA